MASPWVGGEFFVKVPRGSKTSRKGGSNSGPVGKRKTRFYQDNQQPKAQSQAQKAYNATAPRVFRWLNKKTYKAASFEEFLKLGVA